MRTLWASCLFASVLASGFAIDSEASDVKPSDQNEADVARVLKEKGISAEEYLGMMYTAMESQLVVRPQYIDEDQELYDISHEGREVTYWYRLKNFDAKDIDGETLAPALKKALVEQVCQPMKSAFNLGGSVQYRYADAKMVKIVSIGISATDCPQLTPVVGTHSSNF